VYRLPTVDQVAAGPAQPDDDDDAPADVANDSRAASGTATEFGAPEVAPTSTPNHVVAHAKPATVEAAADRSQPASNDDILRSSGEPVADSSPSQTKPPADGPSFFTNNADMVPYMPVSAGLSAQLLPNVQRAYALAQRGSLYAAQTEFIQILRRIAQAKDADEGYDDHSRALAAGLRAIDEADDFAPAGVQLEAEMNVPITVSSHRTPILRDSADNVLPQEAIAEYHCYAEQQLARAVDGEQAGSMALHGLGKVYCRLTEESPNDARHTRKAMTMFLAALDAGPQNQLAANEVGVLLARNGHHAEAAAMFRRAIDLAPTGTAYHNLAACEEQLGQRGQAAADNQYGDQLSARERAAGSVSRSLGVRWVTPQELAGVAQPQPLPPAQRSTPVLASRAVTPLGPAATPPANQPTHAPNSRWW
jgi:tetratricopeptide (TPR) repeat protein